MFGTKCKCKCKCGEIWMKAFKCKCDIFKCKCTCICTQPWSVSLSIYLVLRIKSGVGFFKFCNQSVYPISQSINQSVNDIYEIPCYTETVQLAWSPPFFCSWNQWMLRFRHATKRESKVSRILAHKFHGFRHQKKM